MSGVASRATMARLHATTRAFRRAVDRAEDLVGQWLARCEAPVAVEFSGGKDSSVVLHLVRAQCPDATALHGDDEWILPETDALLHATPNLVRLIRPLRHTEWFTAWADMPGPNGGAKHRWAIAHGIVGVASGMRADENSRRRQHLRSCGPMYRLENGLMRVHPIAAWSVRDVWAYLVSREVPYSRAYDVLEVMGVPWREQRTGPLATDGALGHQIAILKRGWPDLYRQFVARYPEAATYA